MAGHLVPYIFLLTSLILESSASHMRNSSDGGRERESVCVSHELLAENPCRIFLSHTLNRCAEQRQAAKGEFTFTRCDLKCC